MNSFLENVSKNSIIHPDLATTHLLSLKFFAGELGTQTHDHDAILKLKFHIPPA